MSWTHSECNEEMNKTQSALSEFHPQVSIYHLPVVRQRTPPEERQTAPLGQRSELTVAAECAVIRVMWVFFHRQPWQVGEQNKQIRASSEEF